MSCVCCVVHVKLDGILGGYSDYSHSNCNFSLGRGVFLGTQNSKCQVLAKFSLGGGGGQREGESFAKNRVFLPRILAKWAKILPCHAMPNSGNPCIADSLSHYVCGDKWCTMQPRAIHKYVTYLTLPILCTGKWWRIRMLHKWRWVLPTTIETTVLGIRCCSSKWEAKWTSMFL